MPLVANDAPQAVWLSAQRLRWPQVKAEPGMVFKLVASTSAALRPVVGETLSGADGELVLRPSNVSAPDALNQRYRHVAAGIELQLRPVDRHRLATLLTRQLLLVQVDAQQRVRRFSAVQLPGALDDLYSAAASDNAAAALGVQPTALGARFAMWAPTAQQVALCVYDNGRSAARHMQPMRRDARTGIWRLRLPGQQSGRSYRYLVDVVVPGVGLVRNRVTDPYSVSLNTDSQRSLVADLDDPALKPPGWDRHPQPAPLPSATDMVIYELHLRDFSINDSSVPESQRGKYAAFSQPDSQGMRHLRALAQAGVTDLHLLPVFDIASVPETGCRTPSPTGAPDSESQQATVMAGAASDCFNWGYDPLHYGAPEGSYASDAEDGARRIIEFRQMVMGLHAAGLRVGMDLVYNHTSASGQQAQSVLDRIVPGYYHRLNAQGQVERSTCCDNTATEHGMMARLMMDTVLRWSRDYRIDSFRFDLMAHQPRDAMLELKRRLGPKPFIGEGWNFGEVTDGARFVQASQLSLNGTGIGTFSDRSRDALRGRGGLHHQGYLNGLVYDRHPQAPNETGPQDLLHAADMARVGLAGSIRSYRLRTFDDKETPLERIPYGNQPAGYVLQPQEVVNYVENHDNRTLFDENAGKLPPGASREDRTRAQMLGVAITAFSQGIAYFHAGIDLLRSKSMDTNSFDSGDWFNRLDWSAQDNYFGTGLPPKQDNGAEWPVLRELLADVSIKPQPEQIAWMRYVFRDLLRIRASSQLFRMQTADQIRQRLVFHNTGSTQQPTVLVGQLKGDGLVGANFREIVYLVNVDKQAHQMAIPALAGRSYALHPVLQAPEAADQRVQREARYEPEGGRFSVPARSAVVWVLR